MTPHFHQELIAGVDCSVLPAISTVHPPATAKCGARRLIAEAGHPTEAGMHRKSSEAPCFAVMPVEAYHSGV